MATLRIGRPLWLDRAVPRYPTYPALADTISVDVAIVGGGITGAAIAWRFAEAGVRVAVLEAASLGRGSTAASAALLLQEPDNDLRELAKRYGRRAAARIWQLGRGATRDYVRTLRRLKIECDLRAADSVYYAIEPRDAARLRREFRNRHAARLGGRWLDPAALERETGIVGSGGIRTRGNAQIDPYKACLGLIDAAVRSGARVYERSRVRRIRTSADRVDIATDAGHVRAQQVIIATGYATRRFKPLVGRFRLVHTYVVATERLSARARREIGLGDVMLWSTERPYHYARWTNDRRLMLGGGDRPRLARRRRRPALRDGAAGLRAYFERVFPSLSRIETSYAWEGLFAKTPDGLPYIGPHRRYPRHLFALGYGGNGMTFGFLASRLLLDHYRGLGSADHDLFAFNRFR
jgi:glycine/D-amino acid oxidase-like deaminating enzyme